MVSHKKKKPPTKPISEQIAEEIGFDVGIKDLKDHASEIIGRVVKTRRSVLIRKNRTVVARLSPAHEEGACWERLMASGLIDRAPHSRPGRSLRDLDLEPIAVDSGPAVREILSERQAERQEGE